MRSDMIFQVALKSANQIKVLKELEIMHFSYYTDVLIFVAEKIKKSPYQRMRKTMAAIISIAIITIAKIMSFQQIRM